MTGSWLEPIEIQGNVPHRILVVSDSREDYYGTVRLCLDHGQNMELIFKTYAQMPRQGTFDLVILFSPARPVGREQLGEILTGGQGRGLLLVVNGAGAFPEGDARIKGIGRAELPRAIRSILSGREGKP